MKQLNATHKNKNYMFKGIHVLDSKNLESLSWETLGPGSTVASRARMGEFVDSFDDLLLLVFRSRLVLYQLENRRLTKCKALQFVASAGTFFLQRIISVTQSSNLKLFQLLLHTLSSF